MSSTSTSSPLLELPPELRNVIYELVLTSQHPIIFAPDLRQRQTSDFHSNSFKSLTSILGICRQIRPEVGPLILFYDTFEVRTIINCQTTGSIDRLEDIIGRFLNYLAVYDPRLAVNVTLSLDAMLGGEHWIAEDELLDTFTMLQHFFREHPKCNMKAQFVLILGWDTPPCHTARERSAVELSMLVNLREPSTMVPGAIEAFQHTSHHGAISASGLALLRRVMWEDDLIYGMHSLRNLARILSGE